MHTKTEYLIWDKIVHSAKNRIDVNTYGEKAAKISPEILDKLLLHIIVAFASGEDHCSISITSSLTATPYRYSSQRRGDRQYHCG